MPEPPSSKPPPAAVQEICLGRLAGLLELSRTAPWGAATSREAVLACWRKGRLEPPSLASRSNRCTAERHVARVAWFCAHGWRCPVLLGLAPTGRVVVVDGQHRVMAAWALRHRVISARLEAADMDALMGLLGPVRRPISPFYPSPMQLGRARVALPPGFHGANTG